MSEQADDERLLSPGRRPLTIGLLLVVTGIAFEALATATVMPEVANELHGIRLYGWAFSAFMLAMLMGVAIAGPLGDRRGPAAPFAVGLVLFGSGLLGAGLAPSMPLLVVARAVQGAGGGVVFAMAYVAMAMAYPPAARGRLFAVLSSAWVVPGIVGPAVGGAVAEQFGWRAVFFGLVPVLPVAGALTLPSLRRHQPVPNDEGHDALPVLDAVRLAGGAGLVLGGLAADNRLAGLVAVVIGLVLALPAFLRLVPPGTLRGAGPLPAAVASRGLLSFAFFGAEAFVPLALTSLRGWTTTEAGVSLTLAALTWATGAWVQSRKGTAWGRRRTVGAGFVLVGIGVAAMATILVPAVPALVAPLAWAVAGLGMGLASPTTSLIVLEEAPPGRVGRSSAALQLTDTLGAGLGTGLGGAALSIAVAEGWSRRLGIGVADGLAVVAVVVGVLASRQLRGPHDTGEANDSR
ncbi:MAG TPA: MFS transporter [Acidimicrobiales bacterium]|nr:MFS transporter [Acidimicrobiales bacterium]